ncbi:MAG TPA: cysteate synthase [Candidatus Methanoperedens sp.]|nr:cysteate synthase [Candidatus Methanoperedens sp.]HLB71070.1 cysteate synthase [Candidatus Methanoperedens sp.]
MTETKAAFGGSISQFYQTITIPKDMKYHLVCSGCNDVYFDDRMKCVRDSALLRTFYSKRQIELKNVSGMGRFHDWLPVNKIITSDAGPVTYKSTELAAELGLNNLHICFNGYWPEKGAFIKTCSFKELEAFPTVERTRGSGRSLVLASAGNTARAFAHASALTGIDVYIVVPASAKPRMWLPEEPTDSIHLIQMGKNCDYTDSIHLAERLSSLPGMQPEGGARNVARRDGMGTVMLDAAFSMNRMPDHYFQAIGSGTGGIAAWEASLRLLEDGRFGMRLPELHLSQNLPFAPMYNAWKAGRREIIKDLDMPNPKKLIHEMYADILSNREPPYFIGGGVYDALCSTNGTMYGISNSDARTAQQLFESYEGIDIFPPAAVAVASLIEAVNNQKVEAEDYILLNITGGGVKRLEMDYRMYRIEPAVHAENASVPLEEIIGEKVMA